MRGAPGTEVRLEIMRKDQTAPLNLTLTRQIIKVSAVRQEVEGGDVGYVRLTQFNSQAADELKQAFEALATKIPPDQLKGYILDLRNNPGGLLDQAVRVAGAFLTSGEIVSIRGRDPDHIQRFTAVPGRPHRRQAADRADQRRLGLGLGNRRRRPAGPKARDHLGSRTFGKASVQTIIPLGQGNGALRLTTARYYTPVGALAPGARHRARHRGAPGRAEGIGGAGPDAQ